MDSFLEKWTSQQRDKPWLSLSLIIKHTHSCLFACMCVCLCACMQCGHGCLKRVEESVRPSAAGVMTGCEPPSGSGGS